MADCCEQGGCVYGFCAIASFFLTCSCPSGYKCGCLHCAELFFDADFDENTGCHCCCCGIKRTQEYTDEMHKRKLELAKAAGPQKEGMT